MSYSQEEKIMPGFVAYMRVCKVIREIIDKKSVWQKEKGYPKLFAAAVALYSGVIFLSGSGRIIRQ